MATLHLVLAVCFIGGISGQLIIFDTNAAILTSTGFASPTQLVSVAAAGGDRKICYDGTNTFYTSGNQVLMQDGTVVLTLPNGTVIDSLTCCCNLVSVSYLDGTDNVRIISVFTDRDFLNILAVTTISSKVLLKCLLERGIIIVVDDTQVWTIDLDDLSTITPAFTFSGTSGGTTTSIDCCTNTNANGFDLFVLRGNQAYLYASWDGTSGAVTVADGSLARVSVGISTGTANVYVLQRDLFPGDSWFISCYTKASFAAGGSLGMGNVSLSDTTSIPLPFTFLVNGLVVCDTACQDTTCANCTTCTSDCGSCVQGTNDICQCENSLADECIYSSNSATCEVCVDPIDACVFVRMPLALRRSGPPIDVVGVSTANADITFERYVNTGRYNAPNLPQNVAFSSTGGFSGSVSGFSAPLQSSGRGRRFGVYSFTFDPTGNGNAVTIPAIATENSGFTNTRYCYTANSNEAVTLTAKMALPLTKFISSLQWYFTFVDQDTGSASEPVVPPCTFPGNNRLSCALENVQKDTSEGVYEVFRPRRKLRNWHPLFYLFVRRCGADMYGANCNLTCNACVNGWCNSDCGSCVCFPGWMGVDCNTPCNAADEVGQNCGITCSSIFSGNVDCKGLLISYPAKVPCSCRSGLMPPECQNDCEVGYWGPNCAKECPGGNPNCNARTGV